MLKGGPAGTDEALYPRVAMLRSWAVVDSVAAVVFFVSCMGLISFSGLAWALAERWPRFGVFSTNLLIGLLSLGAIAGLLLARKQSAATIGLNRPGWKRILAAVGIAVPACYAVSMVTNLLYIVGTGFDVDGFVAERSEFLAAIPEIPLHWTLPFALFVGIHEEIFFRGFLLSRLRTACRSNAAAIIITSVIFGLLHSYQGLAGVFQTGAIGLVLALVATYARTLWPVIIAHAVFDTIGLVAAPLLSDMLEEMEMVPASAGVG